MATTDNPAVLKPCTTCGKSLPRTLANYGPERRTVDGLRSECRNCQSEYDKRRKRKRRTM